MTGHEFLRRLHALAKRRGVDFRVDPKRGKGSHQTVYLGRRKTVVPDPRREMKVGMAMGILEQLGVTRAEWEGH